MLKKLLWSFFILVVLVMGTIWYETSSYMFPWRVNDSIKHTLSWGGLADLPENIKDFNIEMYGGGFNRTYDMEFTSTETNLKNWISNSKRLKDNNPISITEFISEYEIYPGEENAVGGWVQINWQTYKVKVHILWS
ncbi:MULTISPECIES: hypothetical protein [Pseudoalteromonas]|uniref:Orphan protein n=1 Tax=Pseudoalteromonas distincta TaxID=77608 RepID=A0ABT9GG49_9GAMM|nr:MULTISPECIES: hypothetical protein [Pseudoalteromonas]KHM51082.1 hypothetical protein PL71_00370 [Pseudoalteromonas elyakovii]KID34468.1 hypothetical protein QT16_17220 [Pseudoalteromonas distincta]MBH0067794.1 hypothetical protein [Pseudoalteromonas sp. NZS100]MDP4484841.1 hypothetical protein [Pseudoalteromonas elyakovii]